MNGSNVSRHKIQNKQGFGRNYFLMDSKAIHDRLLAEIPSGATHDSDTCRLCLGVEMPEGGEMSKTFSQEELDAAVATAVGPLNEEIQKLKANVEQTDIESRFSKEKETLENSIAELQSKLDAAVLEAAEAKKQHDELVAFLEAEQAASEAATELARRREERLAKVTEVASFPDEYVEANADRWAAMSDEDFEASLADWQTIAKKDPEKKEDETLPTATAMVASRAPETEVSAVREVLNMRPAGIDPRTL